MIPLYTLWIVDFGIYFYTLYLITIPERFTDHPFYFVASCFAIAHAGAVNMVAGHELVHRRSTVHKFFGNLAYAKFMYPNFLIQHVKSHHKKVATPEDPSTASNWPYNMWICILAQKTPQSRHHSVYTKPLTMANAGNTRWHCHPPTNSYKYPS